MRVVEIEEFAKVIKELLFQSHYFLPEDVISAIRESIKIENGIAKESLLNILKNAEIASLTKLPLCQDTGIPQFFLNIGKGVCFNFNLKEAIGEVVNEFYQQEKLRKSSVEDPLFRKQNFNFFTFFIESCIKEEERVEISVLIRGGGSENMSRFNLFLPTTDFQDIVRYILNEVKDMVKYTCPPVVVGIGIGGTAEISMFLSKKALLRNIGERNKNDFYSETEIFLKQQLNFLNIGPLGLGGNTTVLDVFIETHPTHIATLPISITLQCHSYRKAKIKI